MVCYKTMISNFIMKFVPSFLLVLFKSFFSKFSISYLLYGSILTVVVVSFISLPC
jgi:hypothetical protein